MVHADTILESIVVACRRSDSIPSDVTFATVELDAEGEHSNVSPPVIEFTVENIDRDVSRNTERVGIETDEAGDPIGYIFTRWFDMTITTEILTVAGTKFTHRGLDQDLRETLVIYDTNAINEPLPDPNDPSKPLLDVNWFRVGEITPNNDFGMSPTVRGRTVTIDVGFTHEYRTSELGFEYDTIEDVEGVIESIELTADDEDDDGDSGDTENVNITVKG